jgi:replicative DNA helicase
MKKVPIAHTAEAAALSLIAVDPECLSQLSWDASLFAIDAHRAVFVALAMVAQRTGTTGAVAAISELESTGKLDFCGGRTAVIELLKTIYLAPGPVCVQVAADYRAQLIRAAGYRDAIAAWEEAESDTRGMRSDLPALAEVFARAGEDKSASIETLQDQLNALIDDLERREPLEAFCTGVQSLDNVFRGGIHRGEMLVVGAETSGGKSILLQQAALTSALALKPTVVFSLEMPAKDILRRMASNLIGRRLADTHEIIRGDSAQHTATHRDMASAMGRLMNLPLIIRDDLTEVSEIDSEIRRLAAAKQCDVAIVDYLQIVTMPKADTREQAISELARRIKLTALKCKVCVMAATQLNEEGKIRESRAIGMHADNVVFIEHSEGKSLFRIKKNRRGPRDITIPCVMRGDISRFEHANE